MDLQLNGRTAIVTGASKGIGLAITSALAGEGATVIAGARRLTPDLDALVRAGDVEFVAVDLAEPDAPAQLVRAASAHGPIDILVNNVGATTPRVAGFLSITDEQWFTSINLNLFAAVRMSRAVLPVMLDSSRGCILTIGSVNAFLPDPLVIDYSAAKAALTNFSKSLSKEVGGNGIRVNTISPGPVATDLWLGATGVAQIVAATTGAEPETVAAHAAADSATGRFTKPSEIADLVLFLCSDRAANITGTDVTIDGGLITTL